MGTFDYKTFNGEVFQKYVKKVPDLRLNNILKSGILAQRQDLVARLQDGVGGNFIKEPMMAQIGGNADNYDGSTNITSDTRKTYTQGKIVFGRAHSWTEKDFSKDITGGVDFMPIASEVSKFFSNVNEDALLAILKGVFSMNDTEGAKFVSEHTLDLSNETDPSIGVTSLNDVAQKACGDHKENFTLAIMHSAQATKLENKQIINYYTYTDANGVQRDMTLYTWNGRLVIVDDSCPVTTSGIGTTPTYTTYVIGLGAFEYADLTVNVPYEMDRNPAKNGGETTLYARERKLLAPVGISWKGLASIISPVNSDFETGTNWELAPCTDGTSVYPHKAIALARIISK